MPHTLVFHIIDLAKKLQKAGFKTQPKFLSYSEANALLVINSQKQISQIEIANKLNLKPSSIVTLIDELEKLNLVKRQTLPENRRKHQIALTDQGKIEAKKIKNLTQTLERFVRSKLSEKEAASLFEIIQKLTHHLDNWPANANLPKLSGKEVTNELPGAKQFVAP